MFRWIAMLACAGLPACATTYTQPRPANYIAAASRIANEHSSMFSSDAAVLSDADIAGIMEHRYAPPTLSRIALLPFGLNTWSGWSDEMALATETIVTQVLSRMRASPHIYDASFLPSILVPEQHSVPHLREAAARYQADLLLVFRSSCQSFERYRLLHADQTRAFCNVEAIVLDTRTGLVPFVATSTQTFDAEQAESDLSFRETILRSQLDAIATALAAVSKAVVQFVEDSSTT